MRQWCANNRLNTTNGSSVVGTGSTGASGTSASGPPAPEGIATEPCDVSFTVQVLLTPPGPRLRGATRGDIVGLEGTDVDSTAWSGSTCPRAAAARRNSSGGCRSPGISSCGDFRFVVTCKRGARLPIGGTLGTHFAPRPVETSFLTRSFATKFSRNSLRIRVRDSARRLRAPEG